MTEYEMFKKFTAKHDPNFVRTEMGFQFCDLSARDGIECGDGCVVREACLIFSQEIVPVITKVQYQKYAREYPENCI